MGWYEAITDLWKLVGILKNAELKQTTAAVRIEGANLAKRSRISARTRFKLREEVRIKADLVFEKNVYWLGADRKDPYCPKCWDGDRKLCHMSVSESDRWRCLTLREVCDQAGGREYRPRAVEDNGRDTVTGY
jgi:hypothetical protein